MLELSVNEKNKYTLEGNPNDTNGSLLNGEVVAADIVPVGSSGYHIIYNLQSYNAEVMTFDKTLKTAQIRVNTGIYSVTAKDQFDLLLEKMGLNNQDSTTLRELKAPMPGMVLSVFVKVGDKVVKGDNLFTLEAMKMENIIKATIDATVKAIKIEPADKVVKGQILLQFA